MYTHNPYGTSLDGDVESKNKMIDVNKDSSDSENNYSNANDNNTMINANCEMLPISVYTRAKMNRSNNSSFRVQNVPTLLNAKVLEAPFYNEWQQTK